MPCFKYVMIRHDFKFQRVHDPFLQRVSPVSIIWKPKRWVN